jgi:hypothetical protein
MDRETHFDSRGRLIANAKLVWGSPDISPKFALIQEVRCVYNLKLRKEEEIHWVDLFGRFFLFPAAL